MGNRTKVTAADEAANAKRRQRRAEAFSLRAAGMTYADIGRRLGVSKKQAEKDYKRGCREYGQETVAEHKASANASFDTQLLSLSRAIRALDPLVFGVAPDGTRVPVDLQASRALAGFERVKAYVTKCKAEMNGAYAPLIIESNVNVSHTVGPSPAKARELIRNYFGGNAAVRDSYASDALRDAVAEGAGDAPGPGGSPTAH